MSKQPPPAPTASTVGPCLQIVGRPGTGRLPRAIAPPDHPLSSRKQTGSYKMCFPSEKMTKICTHTGAFQKLYTYAFFA